MKKLIYLCSFLILLSSCSETEMEPIITSNMQSKVVYTVIADSDTISYNGSEILNNDPEKVKKFERIIKSDNSHFVINPSNPTEIIVTKSLDESSRLLDKLRPVKTGKGHREQHTCCASGEVILWDNYSNSGASYVPLSGAYNYNQLYSFPNLGGFDNLTSSFQMINYDPDVDMDFVFFKDANMTGSSMSGKAFAGGGYPGWGFSFSGFAFLGWDNNLSSLTVKWVHHH